jgi:DNA-binding NtrC family response regulator
MQDLADEHKFRKDLVYRINTVDITLPPLRERGEDIARLARHFAVQYAEKYGKGPFELHPDFLKKLESHPFPGNVRELQYTLERAVIMAEDDHLGAEDLVFSKIEHPTAESVASRTSNLEDLEKNTILRVIEKNQGNITKSARELGITRAALYRRLEKYDL